MVSACAPTHVSPSLGRYAAGIAASPVGIATSLGDGFVVTPDPGHIVPPPLGGAIVSRLLTADDVSRVLRRLAHELIEANHGARDLVLLGIQTRGVPLAERLAGLIADIEGVEVPHGALDTTLYRDDLDTKAPRSIGDTRVPVAIDGRTVVLVDDVLYTGRTIRAALDAVAELGRPGSIRLVVLVDRGHRELPIRADHVGKNLPTAYGDHVQVLLAEVDGEDGVIADPAISDGGAA